MKHLQPFNKFNMINESFNDFELPDTRQNEEWADFWVYPGEGYLDIVRSIHSDDFENFTKKIFEAIELLKQTNELTFEEFSEDYGNILTDSFGVLRENRFEHEAIFKPQVQKALIHFINKVKNKDTSNKPY